jgi:hypothetical protein
MIADPDVYGAAKLLVDKHGDGAARRAERRAAELSDEGDAEGAATWRLILNAIVELQRERGPGEALN